MTPDQERKRVGAYAKLLANYASDDALISAGEPAELLFVRGLAFCATSDADGYITDAQVTRIVGAGMRDAMKRADRLAEVGVWERVDGGFNVRSWLKIHESSEQKGRRKKADRERKKAGIQKDSGRNPDGGTPDSLSVIQSSAVTRHDTAVHVDGSLGGDRPETSQPITATEPHQKATCTRHPAGNPSDAPCDGCRAARELDDKRDRRDADKAQREAEAAARACTRCDGVHIVDEKQRPTRRRCDHRSGAVA